MLNQDIVNRLNMPLNPARVTAGQSGPLRGVPYLEGHDVIRTANEIFGFGNWGFELLGLPEIAEKGAQGDKQTPYEVWVAAGRLTVRDCPTFTDVGTCVRQGGGSGGLEMAIKGAATDALKRCLKQYGDQFGLVLYDKKVSPADVKRWWQEATGQQAPELKAPEEFQPPGDPDSPERQAARRVVAAPNSNLHMPPPEEPPQQQAAPTPEPQQQPPPQQPAAPPPEPPAQQQQPQQQAPAEPTAEEYAQAQAQHEASQAPAAPPAEPAGEVPDPNTGEYVDDPVDGIELKTKALVDQCLQMGIGIKWAILALSGPNISDRDSALAWWGKHAQTKLAEYLDRNPQSEWSDVVQRAADLQESHAQQQRQGARA